MTRYRVRTSSLAVMDNSEVIALCLDQEHAELIAESLNETDYDKVAKSTATCDAKSCRAKKSWIPDKYEYPECPEHWSAVWLSDSSGELQLHQLCPVHTKIAWKVLHL